MEANSEIRKLPIRARSKLSSILEINDGWKILMGIIPKTGHSSSGNETKYSAEQVRIIEDEAKRQKKPAFDILIDEWGTSGKQRPHLQELLDLLTKAELYKAGDYISIELLGKGPIPRPLAGPAAQIYSGKDNSMFQSNEEEQSWLVEAQNGHVFMGTNFGDRDHNLTENFNTPLPRLDLAELEYITDRFNMNPVTQNGRKLGAGAFGTVFLGKLPSPSVQDFEGVSIYQKLKLPLDAQVAVKRLHSQKAAEFNVDPNQLFRTEVETMSRYVHDYLLTLLAYAADGTDCCLVYPFMPNGSLEYRLACEDGITPLQWSHRLDVANGVAAALIYLHTSGPQPLVHRDVKSANILLDHNMKPKLGDFGLIRVGASGRSKSLALTSNVQGTSAYMAPEAFRGDISVKLDTFSFGVIILELLTGLPPYDENRDGNDLITHVEAALDEKEFIQLLDPKIPPLLENMTNALHKIALSCLQEKKRERPLMEEVYKELLLVGTSASVGATVL